MACFFVPAGEAFIELSETAVMTDNALLGVRVIALGLVAWILILLAKRKKVISSPSAA